MGRDTTRSLIENYEGIPHYPGMNYWNWKLSTRTLIFKFISTFSFVQLIMHFVETGYLCKVRLASRKIFKSQNKCLLPSGRCEGARFAEDCFSSGWWFGTISLRSDRSQSFYENKERRAEHEGKRERGLYLIKRHYMNHEITLSTEKFGISHHCHYIKTLRRPNGHNWRIILSLELSVASFVPVSVSPH